MSIMRRMPHIGSGTDGVHAKVTCVESTSLLRCKSGPTRRPKPSNFSTALQKMHGACWRISGTMIQSRLQSPHQVPAPASVALSISLCQNHKACLIDMGL